mmetsp:Transcript_59739/g.193594  ORF Transcript_59739/g.193594 Transcript_59739/m.193594 type:complete len:729 (+) Transcript_59739:87-2273(+)
MGPGVLRLFSRACRGCPGAARIAGRSAYRKRRTGIIIATAAGSRGRGALSKISHAGLIRPRLLGKARRRLRKRQKTQEATLLQASKEAKRKAEQEAKEKEYWEARRLAEEEMEARRRAEEESEDRRRAEEQLTPVAPSPEGCAVEGSVAGAKVHVVFWGICDLKYDPRLPLRDRVKVLELGDGRASRFSHHGAAIKQRFDDNYCMDPQPLKRGVMVDNKKFTHDTFVECGFGHLRPKQFAYPRRYDTLLADRIRQDLGVPSKGAVVLKLVNRARGAGVVVCPDADLDSTLKRLLMPPVGRALIDWLAEHAPKALTEDRSMEVLAEQQLHYWSNECPLFVVEELVHSMPVALPVKAENSRVATRFEAAGGTGGAAKASEGEVFDGTMRVAFALQREAKDSDHLDIQWIGGYWKLPPQRATGQPDECCKSLEEARARIVSSFNTEDKRTAPVQKEHLMEVYAALTPALPRVFEVKNMSVRELAFSYPDDPNFRAFAMTRCGAALRVNGDFRHCNHVLEQARRIVKFRGIRDANDTPERSVLSYIIRSTGVNWAIYGDWSRALSHFQDALATLGTNASAHYLQGIALQEQQRWSEAVDCHLKAFALDPDFRSPLMALGECWTHLGKYKEAVEACRLCLHLQPDAPVAQFNAGQAIYQQLRSGSFREDELGIRVADLRARAQHGLEVARADIPQAWTEIEDEILRYFQEELPDCNSLPRQPVRSWKAYGWRP